MATITDLRPSGAGAWSQCALYVTLSAAYRVMLESDNNDVREDGTACHWLAHERSMGVEHSIGEMSPNGRELTEEMFDAVDLYFETLSEYPDIVYQFEQPADCSVIYPQMSGTPDVWGYRPNLLRVGDLKYGFRYVEVFRNPQLSIYALAVATALNLPDECEVELFICQPRTQTKEGPVRKWRTTVGELRQTGLLLRAAAYRAMSPNPCATVGRWCVECEGRIACDSFMHTTNAMIDFAFDGYHTNPTLPQVDKELVFVTDAIEMLQARQSALEVVLERHLKKGGSAKYHQITRSKGRERWAEGCEKIALTLASEMFKVSIAKPITPSQARKKIPSVLVDSLTVRGEGSLKVSRIGKHDVEKAFSNKGK